MAACDNYYRVSAITHAAQTMTDPIGGFIRETVEWVKNYPGVRLSPCIAIQRYALAAAAIFQTWVTPGARGTVGTLTFTLLSIDGTTGTVAVTSCRAGESEFQMSGEVFPQTCNFEFDALNSENLAPITVTL